MSYLPCNRATFYNHNLDKLDTIKDALLKNKVDMKFSMRNKWYESDNATLQISLYKLLSTEDERKRLMQSYTEVTTDNAPAEDPINYENLKSETLKDLIDNIKAREEEAKAYLGIK